MNLLYLLSHVPNPRIYKRMKVAKKQFNISTIYWKRSFSYYNTFFKDNEIKKYEFIDKTQEIYGLSVAKRLLILCKFFLKAIKDMKKVAPDIIHCEHLDMLFIAVIYKILYNRKIKIIYEVADLHKIVYSDSQNILNKVQKKIFITIEMLLCKYINKLIITSPYFWEDYYCKFISEKDILFIPNAPEKKVLKKINNTIKDRFTIGYIGSVRYPEQLKMLIDIAKDLKNFDVLIAGNGSAYNEIAEYSKDVENVTMFGAYDYEKEVSELYSKIDVVYCIYDTKIRNVRVALPNKLYEAIVLNKPIIASKNTKLGDFIESNGIGFIVNDREKEELKNLIEKLIINENQMLDRCKENCKKIEEKYYAEFYTDQLYNLYINLVQ